MDTVLLILRIALALVFFAAAAGKLTDRAGTRTAVIEFGAPFAVAGVFATLLPLAEITAGILLLVTGAAWAGAIASVLLLGTFTLAILVNLMQGRRPDCHCFGVLSSQPIGPSALVRNLVLIAMAAVVVVAGRSDAGTSATAWVGDLSALEAIAIVLTVFIAAVLLASARAMSGVFEHSGRVLVSLDVLEERIVHGPGEESQAAQPPAGLPVGHPAPAFTAQATDGAEVSLQALSVAGLPLFLVFTDADCGPCNELLPEVARWQREDLDFRPVILSSGDPGAVQRKAKSLRARQILFDEDRNLQALFYVSATPSAVLVSADGLIASTLAQGTAEVRALALQASLSAVPAAR